MNRKKEQDAQEKNAQASASDVDAPEANESPKEDDRDSKDRDADETRHDVSGQMIDNDAADIALAAVDELADRDAEIESLKAQLGETKDQLLRKAAEFQNYRRRTEDEKSTLVEFGKSILIQQFLDVLDDLRRSLEAAQKAEKQQDESTGPAYSALKDGVELVYKKFLDELSKHDVKPIEAVGQPFNEDEHEAMMQREVEGKDPGVVVEEIQKGYKMGDRVLRHSKVIVSK